ncbi:hypothetical protein ACYB9B_24020 [Klebsiella pneumoniae]|uniref:hypothetical protein n=1 Tax=Klebsiella TaxID=570 RepID=UPI000983486E|nr:MULTISPECIES: hypothetical protein [Klebsiella]EKZ6087199.1 hypothetical protein [Klebsiella pneumoniae]ELA2117187.1 hypothetical protein [Klebsiella pneumoniae]MBX4816266.1 hypothetical protein [Klebsiella variicola]MCA5546272.1 hypothetical protein [Klebsiella pneumoniae]MCD9767892.1 hypothetical protein [Klebsiella variicola subsp. variicola]
MIPEIYTGGKDDFIVAHCKGATSSLKVAIRSVTPTNKQKKMLISLRLQIERLSSCKRSADLSVRKEGELPSYKGKPRKNFWAIKKIPIRGYYWESERVPKTFFISHYIYKDFDDLHDSDTQKVCNNWDRIERGLDDC